MQSLTHEPVQNYPATNTSFDPETKSRRRRRKVSDQTFEQLLRNFAEQIKREQDKLRKLTEMSVTMQRRFRGLTLSDMCGRYGIRIETQGRWLDYDPDLDGEIHPINIVQPAIRANTNACLQSNVELNIEPANQSAKMAKIAERWQKVAGYLERFTWTEEERTLLFDAIQKDGTILLQSFAKTKDVAKSSAIQERGVFVATYQCDMCGNSGKAELGEEYSEPEVKSEQIPCPDCGKPAKGSINRVQSYEVEDSETEIKQIQHKLYPFFNFVIDSYGAKSKGIGSAKWLEIHELVDRAEIEADYPQFEFSSPNSWSYQLQCDYALASGDFSRLNSSYTSYYTEFSGFDKFERCKVYLHEESYLNYVCPKDYSFVNGHGVESFNIKQGETISEAQERFYGENQKGFLFVWIDDRLRDIVSPEQEEINFRECFTAIHWLRDSSGFHSAPNISIVTVQDDVTLLNTFNHNIVARNAHIPVYFDSMVWGESDFSQEYIGTENAAILNDRDLKNSIYQLPIPTPSPHLQQQLQFLFQIKDTITQVQPAMRGEAQSGETYGAQRQQLEQAYGLLTSALKSFAQAKVKSTKQKFVLCRKFWTLEQFQAAASMEGEEWTDEDVQEMCDVDFEADLIMDYRQGSEMPESNLSREMKFYQGLQQVMGLIQAGAQISPDKLTKILQKIDEMADFDFDLTGLEVDEQISQKRINEVYSLCIPYGDVTLAEIEKAKAEIVTYSPETNEPVTKMDLIIEQIFHSSNIRFSKYENLEQQGRSFTERLRTEIGADKPNYLAIEVFTVILGLLEQAIRETTQQEMEKSPEYQAQEAAKAEQAKMLEEAKRADLEEKQHEVTMKAADHEADLEKMHLQNAQKLLEAENSKEGETKKKNAGSK